MTTSTGHNSSQSIQNNQTKSVGRNLTTDNHERITHSAKAPVGKVAQVAIELERNKEIPSPVMARTLAREQITFENELARVRSVRRDKLAVRAVGIMAGIAAFVLPPRSVNSQYDANTSSAESSNSQPVSVTQSPTEATTSAAQNPNSSPSPQSQEQLTAIHITGTTTADRVSEYRENYDCMGGSTNATLQQDCEIAILGDNQNANPDLVSTFTTFIDGINAHRISGPGNEFADSQYSQRITNLNILNSKISVDGKTDVDTIHIEYGDSAGAKLPSQDAVITFNKQPDDTWTVSNLSQYTK